MRYSKLRINGQPILPGSDFQISVDISPIAGASNLRHTVNGELVDMSRAVFRKYRISISGSGRRSPAISDLMPGANIQITAPEPIFISGADIGRQIAEKVGVKESGGQIAVGPTESFPVWTSIVGVGVRPIFECKVISVNVSYDEHRKDYSWSLEAEER